MQQVQLERLCSENTPALSPWTNFKLGFSYMNWNLDPWYVPTKFDHDQRRTAAGRALTGLAGQND